MIMQQSRFLTLAFCVLLDSLGGLQYMYGTFSVPIKEHFNYTQDVIDGGGLAQNIGTNFGIHAGLLLDLFGPKPMILSGAVLGLVSYSLLFFSITENWQIHDRAFVFYFIMFLQGQAQLMADMSVVPTVSRQFKENAGLAIGLCKSFLGLSGSLAEQIYVSFFKPDSISFILFLGIYFPVLGTICSVFISDEVPVLITDQERRIRTDAASRVITGALRFMPVILFTLLFAILSKFFFEESAPLNMILTLFAFGTVGTMCFYIAVQKDDSTSGSELQHHSSILVPLIPDQNIMNSESRDLIPNSSTDEVGVCIEESCKPNSMNLFQAIRRPAFWIHWATVVSAWGSGLLLIINIGQLCEVVGVSAESRDVFVGLLSVFNCMGRLFFGALSDYLFRKGHPRGNLFGLVVIGIGIGMFILSAGTPGSLLLVTITVGFLYGGCNVLNPAILTEQYGVEYIGSFYSSMMLATICGSYLIATHLFAAIYDKHSIPQARGGDYCVGTPCISESTYIAGTLCFVCGFSYLLFHNTDKLRSLLVSLPPNEA